MFRAPAFDPTAGLRSLQGAMASTMATVARVETMARDLCGFRSALDDYRFTFPTRDLYGLRPLAEEFTFPERALGGAPELPDSVAEVPTSDTTPLSYKMRPGDQVNFINGGAEATRVRIVTACGAEMVSDLHPGAEVHLTVGTSPVRVDLLNVDDDYTGLKIVR